MTAADSRAIGGRRLGWTGVVLGGAVALLVLLCYWSVDRVAATWAHALFSATGPQAWLLPVFIGLTHIVDPVPPLAGLGFVVFGAMLLSADRPWPPARPLFAVCAATLAAITIKDQLKFACGRLWPETWVNNNPSWIANGAYGFAPFHGGAGWSSFPSGHMTMITAPMAVVMLAWPAWRGAAVVPIALVALGLYGADYHFVSDMIAGVFLATVCARIVWHVVARPEGGPARP